VYICGSGYVAYIAFLHGAGCNQDIWVKAPSRCSSVICADMRAVQTDLTSVILSIFVAHPCVLQVNLCSLYNGRSFLECVLVL
jgi:hypothetical protein